MLEVIAETSRFALSLVLIVAIFGKINNQNTFRQNLTESFSVPEKLTNAAFWLIIAIELLLIVGLQLSAQWRPYGFAMVALVFAGFAMTLTFMLLRHQVFKCSCFGATEHNVSFADVLRNVICIALALSGVFAKTAFSFSLFQQLLLVLLALPVSVVLVHFTDFAMMFRKIESA